MKDGDETDVDCGGSCPPCADNKACATDADCTSLYCKNAVCFPASCSDGVQDGTETDVDCGGANCDTQGKTCGFGQKCGTSADCASTFCNSGICGAMVLYTSPTSSAPKHLAIDATNAYIAAQGTSGSALVKVPLDGSAPVTLASSSNGAWDYLAIDSTNVYFTDMVSSGTVNKVPIAGGSTATIAMGQSQPGPLVVDASHAFWINGDGSVNSVGLSGGTVTALAPAGAAAPVYGILVDWSSTYAYYQDAANTGLFRVLTSGAMPAANLIAASPMYCFTLNFSNVFYADANVLYSTPLAGGSPTQLLTSPLGPRSMLLDTASIYWAAGPGATETIYKAPLAGGTPVVLASGQPFVDTVVVDNTFVYWITETDFSLKKVHK
jgi:hypothetical protein